MILPRWNTLAISSSWQWQQAVPGPHYCRLPGAECRLPRLAWPCTVPALATFDQPPALPVRLLNVDLSTVTVLADLILGLGDPLAEIVQLDFQSSAAAWKHADVMAYHALHALRETGKKGRFFRFFS